MTGSYQLVGRQLAAARTLLGLAQDELAKRAKISVSILRQMEESAGPASGLANNVLGVRSILEAAGVIFVEDNGEGLGVRLRKIVETTATVARQSG